MTKDEMMIVKRLNETLGMREHEIIILKQLLWACAKKNGGSISLTKEQCFEAENPEQWLKCGAEPESGDFIIVATTRQEIEKESKNGNKKEN